MNNYHSSNEWIYKPRWIAEKMRSAVKSNPVIVISGARQVGKSTFLRSEKPFNLWSYISLDDYGNIEAAQTFPEGMWMNEQNVIIDEVQKAPNILSAIKATVDKDKRMKFILSGSANLLLMSKVSETLAGRAIYLTLYPMTLGEANFKKPTNLIKKMLEGHLPKPERVEKTEKPEVEIIKGQFPILRQFKKDDDRLRWLESYIATYLERDLRQLSQVASLPDFRRVMEALALRSGQLLNQTEISGDTNVKQPRVYRYINLLKTSSLLDYLPAFRTNRTKRLIKSPKSYWMDSSLAAYLCGHFSADSLKDSREAGSLFEGLIIQHLRVLAELMTPSPRLYYWRTTTGEEVDCVMEHGKKLLAIEITLSKIIKMSDIKNLKLFLEEYPETVACLLIYTGDEIKYLAENIVAIPWQVITGAVGILN